MGLFQVSHSPVSEMPTLFQLFRLSAKIASIGYRGGATAPYAVCYTSTTTLSIGEVLLMEEIQVEKAMNYVHLISGGLDSTYSLMSLVKDILKSKKPKSKINPVFFDYGQYAAESEYHCAKRAVEKIIDEFDANTILENPIHISLRSQLFTWCKNVAFTGIEVGDKSCEIQNRNIVLLSVLASYLFACAERQNIESTVFEIHSGFKNGEMHDCNEDFFHAFCMLMGAYKPNYQIRVMVLPSIGRQKMINKMKKLLKGSESKLHEFKQLTISCYAPVNGKPCGRCWKCNKLKEEKTFDERYGLSR
jgi:7-cyano-7-deazaguanine synthase in queuosine biosynthesis